MLQQKVDPKGVPSTKVPGKQEVDGDLVVKTPIKPLFKKEMNEEKAIKTEAPVKRALVKEYMQDKEISFILDYSSCRMKGKTLITYLCNAGLPIELILNSKEEIHELMYAYFSSRNTAPTESLALIAAAMVLHSRGVDYEHVFSFPFSKDVVDDFVRDNPETFKKINCFLDSLPVYLMATSQNMIDTVDKHPSEVFENIDDERYITSNIVNIIQVPGFLDIIFSTFKEDQEMFYFVPQFERYMFKGLNLFAYFIEAESSVLHFFQGLCGGRVNREELEAIQNSKLEV